MDAVIAWVDSTSSSWRNSYGIHKSEAPFFGLNEARFRNNGELKYLLRSIELNMQFVDNIYIVTAGEAPDFVDFTHERIHLITHEEIAPVGCLLPTFSSDVIETFIHNIKGLSSDFLYFNDDFLVLNPVSKEFFIDSNCYWINQDLPVLNRIEVPNNPWERKLCNTRDRLSSWVNQDITLMTVPHTPRLLRKSIYSKILEMVKEDIGYLRSKRFRDDERELQFQTFYNSMVVNCESIRDEFEIKVCSRRLDRSNSISLHIRDSVEDFISQISLIDEFSPQFICIQDEMDGHVAHSDPRLEAYHAYMNKLFPVKATFER